MTPLCANVLEIGVSNPGEDTKRSVLQIARKFLDNEAIQSF